MISFEFKLSNILFFAKSGESKKTSAREFGHNTFFRNEVAQCCRELSGNQDRSGVAQALSNFFERRRDRTQICGCEFKELPILPK